MKKHINILSISFVFAILYALISLVNHYFFRTYALDLGLYTNAAYKYAHLQLADNNMIKTYYEPILGGHFDLYLILFSPLIYVFGTYTLLIVQIMALVLGGIGVYKYFMLSKQQHISLYASIYFFIFFGIYGALSFDYHSVVIASCIVPWFFIAIQQNQKVRSVILLFLMLIGQENISLWIFFICIGLAIEWRKKKEIIPFLVLCTCFSITYFILITQYVIPYFSAQHRYGGFQYTYLGNSILNAIETILMHPIESIKYIFINHTNNPDVDYIKAETHLLLFLSGIFMLLKKPQYLVMLIPIYFQKFYHDNFNMWGIAAQYNIEFTPILAIGIFHVIADIKNLKIQKIIILSILFLSSFATFKTMDNTILYTDKSRIRFYQAKHYSRNYDVKNVYTHLSAIPKTAKVSAQSPFVPHLSLRDTIYVFPIIKDADYIIYSINEGPYPLSDEEFEQSVNELKNNVGWRILYDDEITILEKKTSRQ